MKRQVLCRFITAGIFSIFFLCVIFCCAKKVTAENPETRLAVDFSNAPQINTELEWRLYKVADIIDAENFRLCDDFAVYPIKFNANNELAMKSLAFTLSAYTSSGKIAPKCVEKTKPSGFMYFDNIDEGWYLLKAEQKVDGDMRVFSSSPILVCIADGKKYGTNWNKYTTVIPKIGVARNGTENKELACAVNIIWENDIINQVDVTVELYKDGELYDTQVLNEENDWYFCWKDLPVINDWTVKEENLPQNYYVNYNWGFDDNEYTKTKFFRITNTFEEDFQPEITTTPVTSTTKPSGLVDSEETSAAETTTTTVNRDTKTAGASEDAMNGDSKTAGASIDAMNAEAANADAKNNSEKLEKLPQTGMNILPIPILAVSGIILILIGWKMSGKSED